MQEKLYEDFTTKLLPNISEGFGMTKDYFLDLFGRYVKYLIVTDSIKAVFFLILAIAGAYSLFRGIKYGKDRGWSAEWEIPLIMFGAMGIIFGGVGFFMSSFDLVKDIYIPEVRVYEMLNANK